MKKLLFLPSLFFFPVFLPVSSLAFSVQLILCLTVSWQLYKSLWFVVFFFFKRSLEKLQHMRSLNVYFDRVGKDMVSIVT